MAASPPPNRTGPRFLIVRLTAMGDLIHGIPVACALRKAFPDAFIGWVAEGCNGELLEGHPAVDQLIRVPRRWLKSPSAVWRLRRELRALRFDTTLDLQCLAKSAIAARLSGARRRIGYGGVHGRELSWLFHNEFVTAGEGHVIDRYLALLRPLGIRFPAVEFQLPEGPEDSVFAEQTLHQLNLVDQGFTIVNPGAGWASKRWPAERYGELARRLAAEYGLPTLAVWGGADELPMAERIIAASGGAAQVAPRTTMTQLASLARRARLFIGSDTGPLHLAVAVGARCVSLHGTSLAAQTGAYGPFNRTVQIVYDDSVGKRRHGDDSAMRAIGVDLVLAACADLLIAQAA